MVENGASSSVPELPASSNALVLPVVTAVSVSACSEMRPPVAVIVFEPSASTPLARATSRNTVLAESAPPTVRLVASASTMLPPAVIESSVPTTLLVLPSSSEPVKTTPCCSVLVCTMPPDSVTPPAVRVMLPPSSEPPVGRSMVAPLVTCSSRLCALLPRAVVPADTAPATVRSAVGASVMEALPATTMPPSAPIVLLPLSARSPPMVPCEVSVPAWTLPPAPSLTVPELPSASVPAVRTAASMASEPAERRASSVVRRHLRVDRHRAGVDDGTDRRR